jgi:hypothetical protein
MSLVLLKNEYRRTVSGFWSIFIIMLVVMGFLSVATFYGCKLHRTSAMKI